MTVLFSRRKLLKGSLAAVGGGLLTACSNTTTTTQPTVTITPTTPKTMPTRVPTAAQNSVRLFASSGFAEDPSRIEMGLSRLFQAGFSITNHTAAYRRFQRFSGSDAERIADFQDMATGRVPTPKVLMGVRGGYGAARILPHIDWVNLGAKMREQQTLLFGFSDVTAIQLALLAQGNMPTFAGPMLYSDFAKAMPDAYTMDSFIQNTTQKQSSVFVGGYQMNNVRNADGILWGGNLSVLASLAGTPYMPKINGGILFLEDVSEQPYRIERMLQTLHLAGILKQQQAIVLGNFSMGNVRDSYDSTYDLNSVAMTIARTANVPVYMGFPFGHITQKTTFPLGAKAQLRPTNNGGYVITFSDYPTLNPAALNLAALKPAPVLDFNNQPRNSTALDSEF